MLDRLHALETFGIKLGLTNITALCAALGHPERAFASLHVAGTNGKGSVTAMAHAALRAAGIRAARYTSPHLVSLNERFVVGDEAVADDDLEAAAAHVLDVADDLVGRAVLAAPPTFFEATTAIAFELFRRAGVEVAVVEVGLGGRFDATNVIAPLAAAITSIGLDHQQQLGDTLESIAFEKAGVIKPGVPVVIGMLGDAAEAVVRRVAAERGAPVLAASAETRVRPEAEGGRHRIEAVTPVDRYGPLTLALRGDHQVQNAVVAIRLLEAARAAGVSLTREAIERGLTAVDWPARLEVLSFGGGRSVVLDAAHNPDGAEALARYLRRWQPERPPLVFGAMRDKKVDGILAALLPVVGPVVTTSAPTPRAAAPEDLAAAVRALDPARAIVVEADPLAAVERAWHDGPIVCVAGSVFLAGAVRGPLRARAIVDSSP